MHGSARTFLATAVLATLVCQGLGLNNAAAAEDPEPDPLVFGPLAGPFPSLRKWCRDQVKENGPHFWAKGCPDRSRLRILNTPQRAASFVSFGGYTQVDQIFWHIAIQTEAGWFVKDDMPLCEGRGCASEPGAVTVLPRSDGTTVLLFHFHHSQSGVVGGYVTEEDSQLLIVCVLKANGTPLCTEGVLPMSATSSGERQPSADPSPPKSSDEDDLVVDVKLALAVEPPRADGMLGLTVTAKRRRVVGRSVEAKGWRRRLAAAIGQHLVALP